MFFSFSQQVATARKLPSTEAIAGATTAKIYLAKPIPNSATFIEQTAQNFKNNPSQDQAHYAILDYLLQTTYANPALDDPFFTAYKRLGDSFQGKDGVRRPTVTSLYTIKQSGVVSSPDGVNFIHDLIQIQANDVILNGWNINDTILTSPFRGGFNDLVYSINERLHNLNHTGDFVYMLNRMSHRDAIQLIPRLPQFAGELENIKITNNTINSTGELQGIFASDGLFRNMEISSNHVNVQGDHTITVNGLLSGMIKDNITNKPIKLLPLRIGGGANTYVVGFKAGTGYAYETISGGQAIDDRRTIPIGAFNYTDVDIPLFRSLLPNYKNNVLALMNRCGVRV